MVISPFVASNVTISPSFIYFLASLTPTIAGKPISLATTKLCDSMEPCSTIKPEASGNKLIQPGSVLLVKIIFPGVNGSVEFSKTDTLAVTLPFPEGIPCKSPAPSPNNTGRGLWL